jgi:hypothetical protein
VIVSSFFSSNKENSVLKISTSIHYIENWFCIAIFHFIIIIIIIIIIIMD